jgi:hypothetical protein
MTERAELEQAAADERNQVTLSDHFERHGLAEHALAHMRAQLKAIPHLRRVYLAKKRVKHFPERACYVLGFAIGSFLRWYNKERAAEALRRIQETLSFPGETLIISIEGDNYRFGRKLRWMRGARVV